MLIIAVAAIYPGLHCAVIPMAPEGAMNPPAVSELARAAFLAHRDEERSPENVNAEYIRNPVVLVFHQPFDIIWCKY